ncbi:MAG: hypothetical protein JXR12_05130 [Neptunomonas phycophila]|uniref:hypothetical protein n=1 Tax=Neptunomonas phycophila TaxID=1572645 RepID=UPI003B8D58DA
MITCPLCSRDIPKEHESKHHLLPKTFKGKEVVVIHKLCHNKIHSVFTERELLQYYHTIERLLENEDMQKFVKWVAKKDPGFYSKTKDQGDRKRKRRGR